MATEPKNDPDAPAEPPGYPEQVKEFYDAMKQSLVPVQHEILGLNGKPMTGAAIEAALMIVADLIAMHPDRNARRVQMKECFNGLPPMVAQRIAQPRGSMLKGRRDGA